MKFVQIGYLLKAVPGENAMLRSDLNEVDEGWIDE